jgi:RHS repeat-associated protein
MKEQTENKNPTSQFLKTDGGKTKSNAIEVPSISLPKGGGAIKGIDEKFSVNAVNGTASFSIPLPFSPARGASPAVSLSYSSGAGNGIFGLGWNMSLASIKRKTDKGLPKYFDNIDSDIFLFSEAEDLVPEFKKKLDGSFSIEANGDYIINEKDSPDGLYKIRFYKPRIEGLFARIERWTGMTTGIIKWRIITKDNLTTLFGWSSGSVITDPNNNKKIFEWLPEIIFDDKGNCSQYIYKKEDDNGFDSALLHNKNRFIGGSITYTNVYLEKVLYCNKTPYKKFDDPFPAETDYLFSTVFDYGEFNQNTPYNKINSWDFRTDAFSDYKAGFEIRTTRLCKRVLLFHRFDGVKEYNGLVKSLNFEYDTSAQKDFTFLKSITAYGYIKKIDGTYTSKKLPATEFEYQKHDWNKDVKTISSEDLVHAPSGLDEQLYQFTDLFNEGLSGILTEQANGWYYKHNLGEGKFEHAKLVIPKRSFIGLGNQLQLADLDADGGRQLISYGTDPKGYFELDDDNEWQGFRNFQSMPNINFGDANTRMIDLNGDGKPEVLISEENVFTWYHSEGRDGFSQAQKTSKPFNEEAGPHIVFADEKQTIFLADMSGDGMTDIVRIRNGEICYWPNLGYGRFGAKVAMDNSPLFDYPDSFNPSFLRLADIDGSGTTDIIYLGRNKFTCWMNLSGNTFNTIPFEIDAFPDVHNQTKITVTDLLANGVACIVWSSPLSKDANVPLKYIDLMNSKKPHIMVSYKNNLGKEVSVEYTPSTKFYIEDKKAGKPWITKLHFPVHCISKTETRDKISGYRFVSSYKYHHGYYDHAEREFRGFGMVEQIDSEHFENWAKGNAANIVNKELHQEPVVTKTWFHTGAFLGREKILNQFAHEYWYEEMNRQGFAVVNHEVPLPDARIIPAPGISNSIIDHLSVEEWQEALRACKGMGLHSETFALDAVKSGNTGEARKRELTPFSVATQNCTIELLQPKGKNKHAIYFVKENEAITYSYERNPDDPRVAHNLNIKLDEYGNVLESAAIVYPRLAADASLPVETQQEQGKTVIIFNQNQFTKDVFDDDVYRLRLPSEAKTFELKGVTKTNPHYVPDDFKDILFDVNSDTASYHEIDKALTGKPQKRLIEHVRSTYYRNNLTGALPLHQLQSLALPFESYQLAYTPELVSDIFGTKVNAALLTEGKFTHSEGDNNWWIRSGTAQFIEGVETLLDVQNRFYIPISYIDPYGSKTKVKYYNNYFLFIEETEDALGNNSAVVVINFRTLSPQRMRDINGNFSEAISDELGIVKATAVFGKGNEADNLSGLFEYETTADDYMVSSFLNPLKKFRYNPIDTDAIALLQNATVRFVYDLNMYKDLGKPVVVASITREEHFKKNNKSSLQLSFEYSNGLGQAVMKKLHVKPGLAWKSDGTGTRSEEDTTPFLRWIGNGRVILNNKGNPVKEYEPYFSTKHLFEDQKELVETGVTPITYYDALGRAIRTELPDGTLTRVEFDSWKQIIYDQNDTISDPQCTWYQNRFNRSIDAELIASGKDPVKEKQAAEKAAKHKKTPATQHFDCLGHPTLSIDHNRNIATGADEFYHTRVEIDIEGNQLNVSDARNNKVVSNKYDMLGNKVYNQSMDTGQRWMLMNIMGNPLYTWDERNHEFHYFYDVLHRLLQTKVTGGDRPNQLSHIIKRIFYGETETNPENKNLRGQVLKHYDTGGLLETPAYHFNGKPVSITRKLFKNYKSIVNWIDANLATELETESYTFITESDALSRIRKETAPDGSVFTPEYDEAGFLRSEILANAEPAITATYISGIEYNEKGLRVSIIFGNGVKSNYQYDKFTFRLISKTTQRANNSFLQDLHYTFDAAGNITHIQDNAIPTVFYNNMRVKPANEYTYDALYRLTEAIGRENNSTLLYDNKDNWNDNAYKKILNPGDPMMSRNYRQLYAYDKAGNIILMKHTTNDSSANWWTRDYEYETTNNRLKNATIGQGTNSFTYQYLHHPQHGFITAMPHLEELEWNFKEELSKTIRQKRTDGGTPETTYYQYDGQGQRLRKITENQANPGKVPSKKEERIYLAGYQLYKKHSGTDTGLERVSLSLMDKGNRFVMIESRNDIDDGTEKYLVRYQLHNHLGSSCLEIDGSAAAKVISYEEFHPYGTTAYQAKNLTIRSASKQYRFTGMERDEETGLEYHNTRYYLPWLGRWLSADSIGIAGGLNLFNYAASCPIALVDDTGSAPKSPERKIGQKQQKAFREQQGMKGAEVQAGHTATVRDAKKSGITKSQWDPAPMQQLHSRRGKGLDVDVKNQDLSKTINTRHNAQEKIADELTKTSMKAEAEGRGVPLDPGKLTPNAQVENANQLVWQTNNVPLDQRDVEALRKSGPAQKSKVDADIDPDTGKVKEGPNTTAVRERASAKKAAASAETPIEAAPVKVKATEGAPGGKKPLFNLNTKISPKVQTFAKVGGGAINVILVGAAVKDAVTQVQQGDYAGATITTGTTVLSFTPLAPVVIAGGVINKYYTDDTIEQRSFAVGDKVLEATGSPVLGGIASAGSAVGISVYETGKDMYNSAVDFVGWGIGKVFFGD